MPNYLKLLAATILLIVQPFAVEAKPPEIKALAESARRTDSGRPVIVEIPQEQLESSVDLGRVAVDMVGGGLLGALISAGQARRKIENMSSNARQSADATIVPLQRSLTDMDVDALAMRTTEIAFANIPWFGSTDFQLDKNADPDSRLKTVSEGSTNQTAFVTYIYQMSPDFTQIQVIADVYLFKKPTARRRGKTPLTPILYQRILSISELPERSYEGFVNVNRWNEQDGLLARQSLQRAFQNLEILIPRSLELNAAEIDVLDDKKQTKAFAAGFYGSLVERNPLDRNGILIWSDGLVLVQPAVADQMPAVETGTAP
ncbi:MAG: hypothetical protein AAGE37_11895 [Pseudomonadota bacterium]